MINEIKVFVASPSDVSEERAIVRKTVEFYDKALGRSRNIHLEVIGWEDVAPDLGDPQNLINTFSEDADLVVVIFYRRFGSPTRDFASGTLEELTLAKERWEKQGRPRLMLYFKDVDPESLADPGPQLAQVLKFRTAFEKDRTGLFKTFSTATQFETEFSRHMLEWLDQSAPGVQAGGPAIPPSLDEDYLRSVIQGYEKASWKGRAVALQGETSDGRRISVSDHLTSWTKDREVRILFLLGGFGSGKTWALKRLAYEHAKAFLGGDRSVPFPVFIPLPKVAADLREQAGKISVELEKVLNSGPFGRKFLLLLDGLDEACFASDVSPVALLRRLSLQLPENSLWIVACRTSVYRQNPELKSFFPIPLDGYSTDHTEEVISSVLARSSEVSIRQITTEEADAFLGSGPAGARWIALRKERPYSHLTRYPVMLQLFERALPELPDLFMPLSLEQVYEKALRVWLMRDARCNSIEGCPERLEALLAELAKLSFFSGATTKSAAISSMKTERDLERSIDALVHAEILSIDNGLRLSFAHHSFLEFFFAKALVDQLRQFDASFLARANLVFAYQVNRFLIPLLKPDEIEAPGNPALHLRLSGPLRSMDSGKRVLARLVTAKEFHLFMARSGWRRATGFGVWGALGALDGTPPVKGSEARSLRIETALHEHSEGDAITGVSWYDAYQFCRWAGGRLPFREELTGSSSIESEDLFEWTQNWFEEEDSLIAVARVAQEASPCFGANPDLRASNLGFRVVFSRS